MSFIERVDERGVGPINVGLDDFAEGSGLLEALVGGHAEMEVESVTR